MVLVIGRLFAVVLAGIAISKSYVDFRSGRESVQMFLLWTVTWLGIVVVALFPSIIDTVLAVGGGNAGVGTFLGIALVFLAGSTGRCNTCIKCFCRSCELQRLAWPLIELPSNRVQMFL